MSPSLRKPPKEVVVSTGPFRGMRDSLDPGVSEPDLATLLLNVYPVDPFGASALAGRPGFQAAGLVALGAGGVVQLITQFTKLDGTEYTVAIVGGTFYTFNWVTRAWANVVTAANLSTKSITLSATATCSSVTLANTLVISDGVNTPWSWDGTSGAGGLTKLTAAPVFYGPMTVYYAKLFGIKAADRKSIVWSEENDPTTGYESGFTNVWSLIQSNSNSLTAICGTNEALYYFRARSVGAITGPVASTFATTGTREGVDETVGTVSPWAVLERNRRIYFLDADGRPHVISPGLGCTPIWSELRETLRAVSRTTISTAQAVDYEPGALVLFGITMSADTVPATTLCYNPHASPPNPCAIWTGFSYRTLAMVKNDAGRPVLMHGTDDGWIYDHGNPEDSLWTDNGDAIAHEVVTSALGYHPASATSYDRVDLTFRVPAPMSSVAVASETPRGVSAPQSVAITSPGITAWDLFYWNINNWPVGAPEAHIGVGIRALEARWLRLYITHAVTGEQFGLMTISARGRFASNSPTLP